MMNYVSEANAATFSIWANSELGAHESHFLTMNQCLQRDVAADIISSRHQP